MRLHLFLLGCALGAGSAGCVMASEADPAAPAASPAVSASVATAVQTPDESLDAAAIRARFGVAQDTLRRVAIGFARKEAFEGKRLSVCLELPCLDGEDAETGRLFVLSDLVCGGHETLRAVVDRERKKLPAGLDNIERLTRLNAATGEHFYTVTVTNLAFRHPIESGYRGLPRFLLEVDEADAAVGANATPVAVVPATGRHGNAVRYQTGGNTLDFSHYSNRVVPASERVGALDVMRLHTTWKRSLERQHGVAAPDRAQWQSDVWKLYETMGTTP